MHDGVGGTIKRKVYQDLSSSKFVIKNAKDFAEYAKQVASIKVEYLDKSEVVTNDVSDAVEIKGLAHLK